jgi:hypothetical protein
MTQILEVVVILAIAVFVIGGLMSMLGSGSVYDQIGKGGLSIGEHSEERQDAQSEADEREQEIRQMLEARSERRQRQGAEPLDIEAELQNIESSAAEEPSLPGAPGTYDPGLIDETRQLIEARNQRRVRDGLEPLDVQAEVTRTLKEFGA